ncbi:MAG: BrnT family toxin [Candidatus Cloacimonetes bacterium]|nr:BrnT family toxin [Candidatus Cloacimonadota bacterium]
MKDLRFVWNETKAKENLRKHKISFEEAQTVFTDSYARIIYDPDHSKSEERFILLGLSSSLRILVVCHCYKEDEMIIRIISARKATKNERKKYGSFLL